MKNEISPNSCRVCLTKSKKLRSLYKPIDEGDEPPNRMLHLITGIQVEKVFIKVIFSFPQTLISYKTTNLQIDEHVTLPKNICKNCELSLSMAFEFRVNALKTQRIVIEYLKDLNKNNFSEEENENNRSNIKNEYDEIMDLETSDGCQDTLDEDITECSLENLNEDELENNALINEEEEYEEQDHTTYLIGEHEDNLNYSEHHRNTEDNELDENEESHNLEDQEDDIEKVQEKDDHDFKFGKTTGHKIGIKNSSKLILKNGKPLEERTRSNSTKKFEEIPRRGRKPMNTTNHIGYICDICGNIFSKRGRMTEHRQRHDKELKYNCE